MENPPRKAPPRCPGRQRGPRPRRARPPRATRIAFVVRTCVACRTQRPRNELVRVALASDGATVAEGRRARAPGRGAYVCRVQACVDRAVESGALDRALKRRELDRSKLRAELRRLIDVDEKTIEHEGDKQHGEAQSS